MRRAEEADIALLLTSDARRQPTTTMLDARRLPRPGLIDSISGTMATGTRRLVAIAALTAVLWFLWAQLYPVDNAGITTIDEPADAAFPRKIWQTWSIPAQELGGTFQSWSVSWIDVNPNYRYELLTSNSASTYVREKYERQRPDIVEVFEALHNDAILRADLLRYLALFADGGVYADMDTDCTRPIDDWIPGEYLPSANLVVGLEYDAQGGEIRGDFTIAASLGQWTFMARPGSPALALVIDKVIEAVLRLYEVNQTMPTFTGEQVIDVTGPHVSSASSFSCCIRCLLIMAPNSRCSQIPSWNT